MTPTPKDPDSFAGWSDADVSPGLVRDTPFPQVGISGLSGQVTDGGMFFGSRLHFHALSAIRIRRPPCSHVRAFP